MNHFMARLIFCFFAEDTDIFNGDGLFTSTIEQMSERDSSNTHEVMSEVFQAMDTKIQDRASANLHRWADQFPYVNGGLFSGSTETPKFSKIARSYLVHIGNLDWTKINPDIFGSMIQAVTDEEERSSLGLHYTSVPNILKVLNPLFLDDIREKLAEAGDSPIKLLNLRKRLSKIRVFDPACGSGNFLVIAYKEMRAIESEINIKRSEEASKTEIPLTNFRGIELRDFPAEIARLALIIAEYQCDVMYRGQKEALAEFLPLNAMNWIVCDNALRLDWLTVCKPTGTKVEIKRDDLFSIEVNQAEIDFKNEGGETYICGNPPYLGSREQSKEQKEDLKNIFDKKLKGWKTLDLVCGWFMKAAEYGRVSDSKIAFVTTNSICQGQHVPLLWPLIYETGHIINFAYTSFKWSNLASHNAGVTVAVIGLSKPDNLMHKLYSSNETNESIIKKVSNINAYLIDGPDILVEKKSNPISSLPEMKYGNYPGDGNHLTLSRQEKQELISKHPEVDRLVRRVYGAQEFIKSLSRFCLWIDDNDLELAKSVPDIDRRISEVKKTRLKSRDASLNKLAGRPHQYRDRNTAEKHLILAPTVSSEQREFLPTELKSYESLTTNQAFALYDAPLWSFSVLCSKLHLVWIATVCGKMKTDFRYSNTMGWNTFPLPKLTEKNKQDLTQSAEDILLARESHFPAAIAELYDPQEMPENLRIAHERNDEVLERIYIGRRFKNDTERLEKLFDLYSKIIDKNKPTIRRKRKES